MFSDGIIERLNGKGEEFNLDRLKKIIIQNRDKNTQEILTLILQEAHDFGTGKKWKDDATAVVIKKIMMTIIVY